MDKRRKSYILRFDKKEEKDVIDRLKNLSFNDRRKYIVALIRADIAKDSPSD